MQRYRLCTVRHTLLRQRLLFPTTSGVVPRQHTSDLRICVAIAPVTVCLPSSRSWQGQDWKQTPPLSSATDTDQLRPAKIFKFSAAAPGHDSKEYDVSPLYRPLPLECMSVAAKLGGAALIQDSAPVLPPVVRCRAAKIYGGP